MQRSEPSFYDITQVLLSSLEHKHESATADIFSIYENASAFYDKKAPWCGGDQEYVTVGSTFLCELMQKKRDWLDEFVQSLMLKMISHADSECLDWRALFCYLHQNHGKILGSIRILNGRGLLDHFFYQVLRESKMTLLEDKSMEPHVFLSEIVSKIEDTTMNHAVLVSIDKQMKIKALKDALVHLRDSLSQLKVELEGRSRVFSFFQENKVEDATPIDAIILTINEYLRSMTHDAPQDILSRLNQVLTLQESTQIRQIIQESGVSQCIVWLLPPAPGAISPTPP